MTAAHPGGERASARTLHRASALLGAFTPDRPFLSLTELTRHLGVSRVTAYRYASALRRANLVEFHTRGARYSLSPHVLGLGAVAVSGQAIRDARAVMERLARTVGETVVLTCWDGERPVVVRTAEPGDRVARIRVRVGAALDLRSAPGQVFCAWLGPGQVPGLAALLAADPDLAARLERARAEGPAGVTCSTTQGIRAQATPVLVGRNVVACLAVLDVPGTARVDVDELTARRLAQAGAALSDPEDAVRPSR
jgi:DNA-binding IclR family transcriptional regulator